MDDRLKQGLFKNFKSFADNECDSDLKVLKYYENKFWINEWVHCIHPIVSAIVYHNHNQIINEVHRKSSANLSSISTQKFIGSDWRPLLRQDFIKDTNL